MSTSDNHSESEPSKVSNRTIYLKLIQTKEEKQLYFRIVEQYHSYVPQRNVVGRHIGWLILLNNQPIGSIGLSSYFLPEPKALKDFIGWEKEAFNRNFNKVAVNWRFTLMSNDLVQSISSAGSQVLGLLAKVAPKEWKKKYGDDLALLVSLVGAGKRGIVYKASGWELIGKTAGSTSHGSISVNKEWAEKKRFQYGGSYRRSKAEQKLIFVKPLVKNWREKLLS